MREAASVINAQSAGRGGASIEDSRGMVETESRVVALARRNHGRKREIGLPELEL